MDELEVLFYIRFIRNYFPRFIRTCYVLENKFYQLGCFRLQGQGTEVVVSSLVGPAAQQYL